jgi:hypothetical protein
MPKTPVPKSKFDEYIDKLAADPSKVGILSEGDSWFAFPLPSRPNVVEVLIKRFSGRAAWMRLESSGDEARIMQAGEQWEKIFKVLTKPRARFDIILFSAGGNDIVGRCLLPLLRQRENWMSWRDCINEQRLQNRLNQVEGAYHEMLALRNDYQPAAWVFSHDYDKAIPSDKPVRIGPFKVGPWMKPYLVKKGIADENDQRQIMWFMLDRFAQMLQKLEQTYERFYHVRTQGTLAEDEWGDEIHPTKAGFEKVATRIQSAICEEFPTLPTP